MIFKEILLVVPENRVENFYQELGQIEQDKQKFFRIYSFPCLRLKKLKLNANDLYSIFQKIQVGFYDYYVFPSSFAVESFLEFFLRFQKILPSTFLSESKFAFVGKKSLLSFERLFCAFFRNPQDLFRAEKIFKTKMQAQELLRDFSPEQKILIFCNKESLFYQQQSLFKERKIRASFVNLYESEFIQNPPLENFKDFLEAKSFSKNLSSSRYIFFSSPKLVRSFCTFISKELPSSFEELEKKNVATVSLGKTTHQETEKFFPRANNLVSTQTTYLSMLDLLLSS